MFGQYFPYPPLTPAASLSHDMYALPLPSTCSAPPAPVSPSTHRSTASSHSTSPSLVYSHSMSPANLLSALPFHTTSLSVDSDAAVTTVAALHLTSQFQSSASPPHSAHHHRRSSAAVATHRIDHELPVSPPLSHPRFVGRVKEEQRRCADSGTVRPPLLQLPELRVNVDMANTSLARSNTPSTTSPVSLPSFTISPVPSTPSSSLPADTEAMVNAIDFEFAATTGKLLRPIRHRKRRRQVCEISPLEVWRCVNEGCGKLYKRTSSVSINRHKEVCEYRVDVAGTTSELGSASRSRSGGSEVLELIRQLLSGEESDEKPLDQLMSMTTDGVSLEQLLTGALSERFVHHITAQLTTLSATKAAPLATSSTPPVAGRKRPHNHVRSVSELPPMMRASATQPPSAPSVHKCITVKPPSDELMADTVSALSPTTSILSPTNSLSCNSLHLRSPFSAPSLSQLPHFTRHARSHSASVGRQHTQLIQSSFLGNGGLLSGLVGTRGGGGGEEKVDAAAALSLKAAQVARAQRELVASLFGHQQQRQQEMTLSH